MYITVMVAMHPILTIPMQTMSGVLQNLTKSAVQAMWGSAQVYSYYSGEHSRTSWDNSAGDMIAYNNSN